MAIGRRIREIRKRKELTLGQLGQATQISKPYLSEIERGQTLPPPETFESIAEHLELPDEVHDDLLEDLLFARDCLEIKRLGYDPQVAAAAVALNRLDPETREAVIEKLRDEFPELLPSGEPGSKDEGATALGQA